ncbi:MAG: PKD domain-containing protein [Bacteroidales bacterium]|nr:PKD domain-containing protein [Bacteroidales bacterium]
MRKINLFVVVFILLLSAQIYAQCTITSYANGTPSSIQVCPGTNVVLSAVGNCPTYLMNNDFNLGHAGTGWQATNQAMFTNPCAPHSPDGTTYMWMGSTSTAPRILTTVPFNVSSGGTISFQMRYAVQSLSSPCEGPDLYNEGIAVQYSTNNGSTWVTIAYYAPNGNILTAIPTSTSPGTSGQTPFTVWTTQTLQIPAAAQTNATRFRWAQTVSTSNVYDHWGIDNVTIGVPPPNINIWWAHGPTGPNPPTVSPTTTTTYTVYISNQTETVQNSVQVIVQQPAVLQINNLPSSVCSNSGTIALSGNPAGGTFSGPGMSGNIFNPATAGAGQHTITYSYNTSVGCNSTTTKVINVLPAPNANAGTDQIICAGQSANLTAFGGVSYVWSNNNQTQNINVTPNVNTTYVVSVTGANGCSATDNVVVTVNPLPIANAGNNVYICIGNSTQLNASGGSSFVWSPATGLSNTNTPNPLATPNATTTYTVLLTDGNGCTSTSSVVVTVNSLPPANAGIDQSICVGYSAILNASGGTSYTWSPATGLNNTNTFSPTANPSITTTYTVTATDASGCSATDNMVLTVLTLPPVNAGPDASVCFGSSTQLNASGGVSYAWSPATGLNNTNIFNPTANPSLTTTYTVTATDASGCSATDNMVLTVLALPPANAGIDTAVCSGTSAHLNASGGVSYTWSPQNSLNNNNINNPVASPQNTTTYMVSVTDANGCLQTDAVVVSILSLPNASGGNNSAVCEGFSTQLTASGGVSYVWNTGDITPVITVSPPSTTTYTVTVTDQFTCSETSSVVVQVNYPPPANAGQDFSLCLGDFGSLNASGGTQYQWSPTYGLSDIGIAAPTVSPPMTTTYTVTVTDIDGCSATDDVTVSIFPAPNIAFNADVYNGCSPLSVNFNDLSTPQMQSWLWNFGDTNSSNNSSSLQNPLHTFQNPGAYSIALTVTTPDGCQKTLQYNNIINVYPNPVASFNASPDTGSIEQPTISFTDESIGASTWLWNFGDPASGSNNYSNNQNPEHAFYNEGLYIVYLSVQSQFGCTDSAFAQIRILPEFTFYVPNTFTPNGDGINDHFRGYGESIIDYKMYIYNRWGALIFESDNINSAWDGRSSSNFMVLPQDVYVYKIILKDINGKEHRFVGHVTLL